MRPDASDASRLYDAYLDAALAGRVESPRDYLERHGHPVESSLVDNLELVHQMALKGRFSRGQALDTSQLPARQLGDFRLIRHLGGGGMGLVFVAEQVSLGRLVALKVIRDRYRAFPQIGERFVREAQAVARLRHPSVVTVFGFGEQDGTLYLAMDLIPGCSLKQQLEQTGGPLPTADVLRWGAEIADALQTAHEAGVLHRDVKPNNILVSPNERAVLVDFGLARLTDADWATLTGDFIGTPAYASPEQLTEASSKQIDARTDVYSLGVTLYQALGGQLPFGNLSPVHMAEAIRCGNPRPLRELNADITPELERTVLRAMAVDPADRYPSARALAEQLQRLRLVDYPSVGPDDDTHPSRARASSGELPAVIAGCRLEQLLGQGAQGRVFRATHVALQQPRAVKVMAGWLLDNPAAAERFVREARLACQIGHPNVVTVYDVGRDAGTMWLVMELIEGTDLKTIVGEQGPLPWSRAVALISDIGAGLDKAHRLGVLHRDVKPSNMVLDHNTDRVVLTDFGLAKDTGSGESLTATGALLGTPVTMAPEICAGGKAVPASDQYALAISLYYLISGRFPFDASSALGLLQKQIHEEPPDLGALVPDCPRPIALAVHQALAKDPTLRYPSIGRFVDALRVRPVLRRPEEVDWSHPLVKVALGVLLLVFGFFGWVLLSGKGESEASGRREPPRKRVADRPAPVEPEPPAAKKPRAAKPTSPGALRTYDYDFSDARQLADFESSPGGPQASHDAAGKTVRLHRPGWWRHRTRFTDATLTVWVSNRQPQGLGEWQLSYGARQGKPEYRGELMMWRESKYRKILLYFKTLTDRFEILGERRFPGIPRPGSVWQFSLAREGARLTLRGPDGTTIQAGHAGLTRGYLGIYYEDGFRELSLRRLRIVGRVDPTWRAEKQ